MFLRRLGALLVIFAIAVPSAFAALETGKAEGTITINRKPVKLKYAFARVDKDYEGKDQGFIVVVTDKPVLRAVITDDQRFSKAIENGEFAAAIVKFDANKEPQQVEVRSKALQHRSMSMAGTNVQITDVAFGADAVDGVVTIEDSEFFSDVVATNFKFRAPLGKDGKFGESAAASAELAASRPKIADGRASGSLKIDGMDVKLAHSIARTKPNAFDEKKTDVVVLLTNEPATNEMLLDDGKRSAAVDSGTLRGLMVTLDSDEKPYHLHVLVPKGFQLSGSGIWNFDPYDFSNQHVSAKFFTTEAQSFMGERSYTYDVTFAVPVQAIKAPDEITVDASTGTKLPANGGDPGKAYMAFDKAARTGNLNELKKLASKTRPLPDVTPDEMKEMLAMLKALRPAKVKVNGGFVDGDHATLSTEAEDPDSKAKMKGTIEMAREDGAWKVLAEKWRL